RRRRFLDRARSTSCYCDAHTCSTTALSSSRPSRSSSHWRRSCALEVLLHRLEIAALPSAVAVACVTVGHIAVPPPDPGAARRRQPAVLRIRSGGGEFGGSPRLDDPPARFELQVLSRDVAVPYRERGAFLRRNLRLLPAGDVFVAAAAEPSVVDVLRPCRDKV